MAFNTKGITIDIGGDASGFEQAMRKTKHEVQGLDRELSKVSRAMKSSFNSNATGMDLFISKQGLLQNKYANLIKQMSNVKQAIATNEELWKQQAAAFGENSAEAMETAQHLEYLRAEEALLKSQLDQVSASMLTCSTGMMKMHQHLGNVASAAEKAANALKPISMISAAGIAGATAAAINFEDAWVGVTKTVDGTPEQMAAINSGLKDLALNTASSYENLAHYAELGGQMGVATDSILGFTKTIAMLGDTTNIVGEEAAESLAHMANIMVDKGQRTTDYYERFGSTVVDLGNNFATTESEIVDMATRLATAGRQVGMTTPQVLALSTALSSMGIKAAAGGGSMSKLMKQIQVAVSTGSESLQDYADTAGMTAEQFAKAWRDDAGTAFMKFLEGIGKSEDVTAKLAELGIEEVRMSNAAGALAQSTDVYSDALGRANQAWSENTAMVIEAEKRYATTKTALLQAWEAIKQAGASLGESFAPTVKELANMVKDLAKWFSELPAPVKDAVAKMLLFGAALSPTAKGISKVAGFGQKLIEFFWSASGGATTLARGLSKIAPNLFSMSRATTNTAKHMGKYAASALEAADSTEVANASFAGLLGTTGGVVVGLAAVAAGVLTAAKVIKDNMVSAIHEEIKAVGGADAAHASLIDSSKEYAQEAQNQANAAQEVMRSYETNAAMADTLATKIQYLNGIENLSATQKAQLKQAVDELNRIYPELNLSVDENTGHVNGNTDALAQNLEQAKKNAKERALLEASQKQLEAITQQKMAYDNARASLGYWNQQVKDATAAQQEAARIYGAGSEQYLEAGKRVTSATNEQVLAQQALKDILAEGATSWSDYFSTINNMGGEASKLNQTLITEFQGMIQQASEAGIQIPESIKQGIESGSMAPTEAIQYMTAMMNYMDMVSAAGETGTAIPTTMASEILANAGSAQEAANMLNNMIQFQQALEAANLAGRAIPMDMAAGIAAGTISVQEAVNMLSHGSAEGLNKSGEYAAAGKGNADAYSNAQASGVKAGTEQSLSAMTSAFLSGKASSAAGTEGQRSASKFNEGISKIPGKTGTVLSDTTARFGGSGVPGAAGSMGTRATSAFERGISGIPAAAQTVYDQTKTIIDQIQELTNRTFTVKVTKEVKTVETGAPKLRPAPPRPRMLTTMSADSVGVSEPTAMFAARAKSPVSATIEEAVGAAGMTMAYENSNRLDALARKMDSMINALTNGRTEELLQVIADKSEKVIVMDGVSVGRLVSKTVRDVNNADAALRTKLMGG
ncbi:phage tail tape measure protein [Faecalibaculum rodentium]|uniref:phage tail tape measure protein n=1 Tax=Faecalibaculum rodentium TaxID=1702221 RepID=UPI00256F22F8|nr:phage tail tape measure protein [Faecalibaculum rodentium]